jgi:hypothetical protein
VLKSDAAVLKLLHVKFIRKVALHLGYGTYIWLSVLKLPLQCAIVSLYSVVKQRLKWNMGKVFFLLTMSLRRQ